MKKFPIFKNNLEKKHVECFKFFFSVLFFHVSKERCGRTLGRT